MKTQKNFDLEGKKICIIDIDGTLLEEFKQIFNRLVTIYAEDEEQAMKVVEQTYLKTDLLDDNEKDLVGIEAKILEKNGEKVDRKEEIPENFENFLDENDIEYLEGLTNEIEENLGEIKEVLGANMVEDCAYNN